MGQYFFFRNLVRGEPNRFGVMENMGLLWAKNMLYLADKEQLAIFRQLIDDNGWDSADYILAQGDEGDCVCCHNGMLSQWKLGL